MDTLKIDFLVKDSKITIATLLCKLLQRINICTEQIYQLTLVLQFEQSHLPQIHKEPNKGNNTLSLSWACHLKRSTESNSVYRHYNAIYASITRLKKNQSI